MAGRLALIVILLAPTLGARAAMAEGAQCPENSVELRRWHEGNTDYARCRCNPGFVHVNQRCVRPAAPGMTAGMQAVFQRAQAGAREDGVCRTAPAGDVRTIESFYDRAMAGSVMWVNIAGFGDMRASCGVFRVRSTFAREGRKCLTYDTWKCDLGGTCSVGAVNRTTCKTEKGDWSL